MKSLRWIIKRGVCMPLSRMAVEIFISYASADESYRRQLEPYLSVLKRQGLISLYHDQLIDPGSDWTKARDAYLETASLILLLISADFLASDYCIGTEMKRALERHKAGVACVIPILVRPVMWKGTLFERLLMLPTGDRPIMMWPSRDEAFANVAAGIQRAIENLPRFSAPSPHMVLSGVQSSHNLPEHPGSRGDYENAGPMYARALVTKEPQLAVAHPDIVQSLNHLASLYWKQGKYNEAEPFLLRALTIRVQQLGEAHPETAQCLNNLATLYRSQDKYDAAEPLLLRALAIREQRLGAAHPDTVQSLNNLAGVYRYLGKYDEAEPLLLRALTIRVQQLGEAHPETAQCLNNLAALNRSQGRYDEAEPLLLRALAIRVQELGEGHPETAQSLNNLAALYRSQGQYSEAEPLYARALAINDRQLGPAHP